LILVRDIAADDQRSAPQCLDRGSRLGQVVGVDSQGADVRPESGEGQADGPTDATTGARDERNLIVEQHAFTPTDQPAARPVVRTRWAINTDSASTFGCS